jgi:hypothetical protein
MRGGVYPIAIAYSGDGMLAPAAGAGTLTVLGQPSATFDPSEAQRLTVTNRSLPRKERLTARVFVLFKQNRGEEVDGGLVVFSIFDPVTKTTQSFESPVIHGRATTVADLQRMSEPGIYQIDIRYVPLGFGLILPSASSIDYRVE